MVGMKLDEVCMVLLLTIGFCWESFTRIYIRLVDVRVTTGVNTEVKTGWHQKGFNVQKSSEVAKKLKSHTTISMKFFTAAASRCTLRPKLDHALYLSVQYLRAALLFSLELQSVQSETDWCIFSNRGSGTGSNVWNIHSYDLAKYCWRRIGQKLPTYGLEDLACFQPAEAQAESE